MLRLLDVVAPLARHGHVFKKEEVQAALCGVTREDDKTLLKFGEQQALAGLVGSILHAECAEMTAHARRAKPRCEVDGAFVPAHRRLAHSLVWVQQLAPGVSGQPGEGA